MKKSWIEKRDCEKSFKIKTIDKKFADIPKGSKNANSLASNYRRVCEINTLW